jgi:hypothetical protein
MLARTWTENEHRLDVLCATQGVTYRNVLAPGVTKCDKPLYFIFSDVVDIRFCIRK